MKPVQPSLITVMVTVVASGPIVTADTIHVPAAFATIQEAIDDLDTLDGDVIVVAPGTYFENVNFFGKAITLRSIDPNDPQVVAATTIDGGGFDTAVVCNSGEGPGSVLEGFTITHASGAVGGGMFIFLSSPTVINCTFIDNDADFGGGLSINVSSSPTVYHCRFLGNVADYGGGVYVSASSSVLLVNCSFGGNAANEGGAIFNCGGSPTLINCTLSDNSSISAGGGMYVCNGTLSLTNSILWGNAPDQIFQEVHVAVVTYSDVQGGFNGLGNINADPRFLDHDGLDYMPGTRDDDRGLSVDSPCIDAGDNTVVPPDTVDLDGDGDTTEPIQLDLALAPRFLDHPPTADTGNPDGIHPIIDMGAREKQIYVCPPDCGNGDAQVGIQDFLEVLRQWGEPGTCDLDGDGVGLGDLLGVIEAWGPCP